MPDIPATIYDPDKTFDENVDLGPFPKDSAKETYINVGEPKYSFLGHKLYSPFGIGAGSLPSSKHVAYAFKAGFDVVCYKTQRSVVFPCNPYPNVVYIDLKGDLTMDRAKEPLTAHMSSDQPVSSLSITNSFGNPSRGPDFWVEDMKLAAKSAGKGQLLISSVVGTIQDGFSQEDYYEDFAKAAELAKNAGVKAIEVNLSCPNVASEGVVCYSPEAVLSILRRTKEKIGNTPLIAKIGYYSEQQQPLLEKIVKESSPYLSAFSAINTIQATVVNDHGEQILPGEGRLKAGVCGHGIKWAGLDMVKRLTELKKKLSLDFEIIGIGGVAGPKDFNEYRKAGANVVQSVTAAMWNDQLAAEIKATL